MGANSSLPVKIEVIPISDQDKYYQGKFYHDKYYQGNFARQ